MTFDEIKNTCIFRYRNVNPNTIKEITEGKIWHSIVKELNDPFEFPINVNWNDLKLDNTDSIVRYAKYFDFYSSDDLTYMIFNGRSEELYHSVLKNLNKLRYGLSDYYNSLLVSCFSNNPDSALMWSHYADAMRGVCIAYNQEILKSSENFTLIPVDYNKVPESFDYNDLKFFPKNDDVKFFNYETGKNEIGQYRYVRLKNIAYLYQKHERWSYEGELRNIIDPNVSTNGNLISFPKESIKAIIVGCYINSEYLKKIERYCNENNIYIFMAEPNKQDYTVNIGCYKNNLKITL